LAKVGFTTGLGILPLFGKLSRFRSHTQAADEATAASNSCHSTPACAMHSGSFGNNNGICYLADLEM